MKKNSNMAKYEQISLKESIKTEEFRSKWGINLPVFRSDFAMVTALIQKLTTET